MPPDLCATAGPTAAGKAWRAAARWLPGCASSSLPPRRLTAAQICALAEQGDPLAQRSVEREGYYLGLGLANLITLFTPDAIALGGGVMKSSHLILPRAREVIRDICTQVPAAKTQITLASLGADTGLAGAAQAWLCRYQ